MFTIDLAQMIIMNTREHRIKHFQIFPFFRRSSSANERFLFFKEIEARADIQFSMVKFLFFCECVTVYAMQCKRFEQWERKEDEKKTAKMKNDRWGETSKQTKNVLRVKEHESQLIPFESMRKSNALNSMKEQERA